jgi:hypothetical protein
LATNFTQQDAVLAKLIIRWEQVGQKLVALAAEVPENKFDYRAAESVRAAAEVLRHVAFWNLYVADIARAKKAHDMANELPKAEFGAKTQIVDALEQSVADAADALKKQESSLTPEMAQMLVTFIAHTCEHHGQPVVYARLNGIIPPASRG